MSRIYKSIYKGNDRISKVIKNNQVVWQRQESNIVVYQSSGSPRYTINVNPNTRYQINTNRDSDLYTIVDSNSYKILSTISGGEVFTTPFNVTNILISNKSFNIFDLKLIKI